jgi:two-component system, sensor histidine kinase PdtaS
MKRFERQLERLPILTDRRMVAYAITLALCAAALWFRMVLDPFFPPGFPYLTFFPAVILSSFLFGRGPGIVAAILCGLMAWFFFIPPAFSFDLGHGTPIALIFYVGVVTVDILLIHWMQRANTRLASERERSRALAERTELLFNELQHRVSNNLQMVAAMLTLQKRSLPEGEGRRTLADAADKLHLIGRIQRQLYSTRGEQLPLDEFVIGLIRDLVAAAGQPGISHRVEARTALMLPPDGAIPLALILAEGVANAIEHGFADRATGTIAVTLVRDGDTLSLSVEDDGVGVSDRFDVERVDSLGLRIARSLAQRLGGRLEITPQQPGTVMRLNGIDIAAMRSTHSGQPAERPDDRH